MATAFSGLTAPCCLGLVVVADDAAREKFGGSGDVGEAAGEHAAGGGLGDGEGFFAGAEQIGGDFGERIVAVAHEVFAEEAAAFLGDFVELSE
jgi:hypothetical protein